MPCRIFLSFLLFFLNSLQLCGQAFREPVKDKLGIKVSLNSVFTQDGITEIEQKVKELNEKYDYDIAILMSQLPIELKRKEPFTQEILNNLEEETLDLAYKNYGKLDIGPKPKNKGILLAFDFRVHEDRSSQQLTYYAYQHIAFGKEASLLMKVGLASFHQETKIHLYGNDKSSNDAHLLDLLHKIEEYLILEEKNGDNVLPIGPILIYYGKKIEFKKKAKEDKFDWYILKESQCVLKFLDLNIYQKEFELKDFSVNLYYDFKHNVLHSASISYNQDNPVSIGQLEFIDVALKNAELGVNKEGNLSGTVNLKASTTEDVDLLHMLRVRKGINGDFSFTFAGENSFNGSFDLSGIKGINIDMMKGATPLASISNMAFSDKGVLSGKLVLKEKPEFPVGVATAEVKKLDLSVKYSLKEGLEVPKGVAKLSLKNIKGVEGSLAFDLLYTEKGGLEAKLAEEGKNLKGFGCTFDDLEAGISIDSEWNIKKISGHFKMQHPELSGRINVENFIIENGTLTSFKAVDSEVSYAGFKFSLKKMEYRDKTLSFSAYMLLKMSKQYYTDVSVDHFSINEDGKITVKKIRGALSYPGIDMAFEASYTETKFSGELKKGSIKPLGINIKGGFDIGTSTYGKKVFDYGYAELSIESTAGVNVPGTPLKITKFGGLGGYNYSVVLKNDDPMASFIKRPEYGTYVMGIELGVADVTNLVGINGKTIIQVGDKVFRLMLMGDISIPRKSPNFKGGLLMYYVSEDDKSTFSGNLHSQIKIPAASGSIFKTNELKLAFEVGAEKWWVKSDKLHADLFGLVDFDGGIDFKGGFEEGEEITGSAYGSIEAGFSYSFDEDLSISDWDVAGAKGHLSASVKAGGELILEKDHFTMTSTASFKANGSLDCYLLGDLFEAHYSASALAEGTLKIDSDYLQVSAKLFMQFIERNEDGKPTDTYTTDIEGCQKLTLNDISFKDCEHTSY